MNMATKIEADPNLVPSTLAIAGKRRIVELWATFHTLSQVREIMRAETGLTWPDSTLIYYDVGRSNSRASPQLKAFYADTRKRYVEEAKDVAIAHQAHRLRKLEDIVEKATKSKDYNAALKGIELAAKEMGGLTQTVKHEGVVGHIHAHQHSIEDARSEVALRLQQLVDGMALGTVDTGQTVDAVATEQEGGGP